MLKHFLAVLLIFVMGVSAYSADLPQSNLENDVIVGGAQKESAQLTDKFIQEVETGYNIRDQNQAVTATTGSYKTMENEASVLISGTQIEEPKSNALSMYPAVSMIASPVSYCASPEGMLARCLSDIVAK